MHIIGLVSRQPQRLSVTVDGTPSVTTTDYVITRQDGGACSITVAYAWLTGVNTVELALSAPLASDFIYVVSLPNAAGAPSAAVSYRTPATPVQPSASNAEDPEAEVFGVDIDWLADGLTGAGDAPVIRGRQCLVNDLTMIALIEPGEIFHRPGDGAALPTQVNGPTLPGQVSAMQARLKREWAKDARVRPGGIQAPVDVSTVGQVTVSAVITPVAVDEPLTFKLAPSIPISLPAVQQVR